MTLLFQLSVYSLFIDFRGRMSRGATVTAGFRHELSEYGSLGIKRGIYYGVKLASGGQRRELCQEETMHLFRLAQFAISEIRPGLKSAGGNRTERCELLSLVRRLLLRYPALFADRAFPFRVALNNVIIDEMAKSCSIQMDAQELHACWIPVDGM